MMIRTHLHSGSDSHTLSLPSCLATSMLRECLPLRAHHLITAALLSYKIQTRSGRALVMRDIMAKTLESGMRVVWMPTRARSRAMRCPVYSGAASATTTCLRVRFLTC